MSFLDGVFGEIGQVIQDAENAITAYQNGIQTGQPAQGGSGGGYQFTPDEMQDVLSQWQQLRFKIESAKTQTDGMTTVTAPGKESASDTAVSAINQSGTAYMDHLNAMSQYADKYIQALQTALTNYHNAEQSGQAKMQTVQTQL